MRKKLNTGCQPGDLYVIHTFPFIHATINYYLKTQSMTLIHVQTAEETQRHNNQILLWHQTLSRLIKHGRIVLVIQSQEF